MLWCALYLNDVMIGHASAQRLDGGEDPDDLNTYRATVSAFLGRTWHGQITHRYGDGGWELMRKVIEASQSDRPAEQEPELGHAILEAFPPQDRRGVLIAEPPEGGGSGPAVDSA